MEDVQAVEAVAEAVVTEAEAANRCAFCPHMADVAPPPPQPDLATAARMHFRCGHSIHTHCILYKLYTDDISAMRFSCPTCNERVIHDEGYQWLRNFRRHREGVPPNLENLWKTNEVFREDVKGLYKIQKEFASVDKQYGKCLTELKKEWKNTIDPYKNILKAEKEKIMNKFKELPFRSKRNYLSGKMSLNTDRVCRTYDIHKYELASLAHIPGAPNIQRTHWFRRYRTSTYYLFGRITF
jgi:hypothetical protein